MSAYVVDSKTINCVVTGIDLGQYRHGPMEKALKAIRGAFPEFDGQPKSLGKLMDALNRKSVFERYGRTDVGPAGISDYHYRVEMTGHHQLLKSLQCWLYQSCEGGCQEDPLYKILDKFASDLAMHIVCNDPKYEAAVWG